MDGVRYSETTESLITAAAEAGYSVSRRDIARWHRAGLLPRPTTEYLGKPLGTRSIYRADARPRLLAILPYRVGKKLRPIPELLWDLFGEGFPIEERHIRRIVVDAAKLIEGVVAGSLLLVQAADDFDPRANVAYGELDAGLARRRRGPMRHILPHQVANQIVDLLAGEADAVGNLMSAFGPSAVDAATLDARARALTAAVATLRTGTLGTIAKETSLSDLQPVCMALANESRRMLDVVRVLRATPSAAWTEELLVAQERLAAEMRSPEYLLWMLAQQRAGAIPAIHDMFRQLIVVPGPDPQ